MRSASAIARELRDSTGQTLVALSINLSALKSQSEGLSPQAARIMTDSLELVQEITKEVRTLSSASRSAEIRIDREPNFVRVEIEDHGKGMPPLDRRRSFSGVGIAGMRERIYQLGGTLEIQSGQKGTLIRASLPVDGPVKTDDIERAS